MNRLSVTLIALLAVVGGLATWRASYGRPPDVSLNGVAVSEGDTSTDFVVPAVGTAGTEVSLRRPIGPDVEPTGGGSFTLSVDVDAKVGEGWPEEIMILPGVKLRDFRAEGHSIDELMAAGMAIKELEREYAQRLLDDFPYLRHRLVAREDAAVMQEAGAVVLRVRESGVTRFLPCDMIQAGPVLRLRDVAVDILWAAVYQQFVLTRLGERVEVGDVVPHEDGFGFDVFSTDGQPVASHQMAVPGTVY